MLGRKATRTLRLFQRGLSLVEQMVAMAVGMIIVAAAISMYMSGFKGNVAVQRMAKLNQELRSVAMLAARDLRRAGYWGVSGRLQDVSSTTALTLSGMTGTVAITTATLGSRLGNTLDGMTLMYYNGTRTYGGTLSYDSGNSRYNLAISGTFPTASLAAGTWTVINPFAGITDGDGNAINAGDEVPSIVFKYDDNGDGTKDTGDGDGKLSAQECYGYQYNSTNKSVETLKTWTATSAGGCTASASEAISDTDNVDITVFTIRDRSMPVMHVGAFDQQVREYEILISGRMKRDTGIQSTLRETVRIGADRMTMHVFP